MNVEKFEYWICTNVKNEMLTWSYATDLGTLLHSLGKPSLPLIHPLYLAVHRLLTLAFPIFNLKKINLTLQTISSIIGFQCQHGIGKNQIQNRISGTRIEKKTWNNFWWTMYHHYHLCVMFSSSSKLFPKESVKPIV